MVTLSGLSSTGFSASVLHKSLSMNNRTLGKATERLVSGLSINRAADDAAGLSLSESLTTSIKGYQVIERNLGDGMSLANTADAGLDNISSELQRMRELVVQAQNDTYGTEDLNALQNELDASRTNIDSISSTTSFNGKTLLDGSTGTVSVNSSVDGSSTIGLDLGNDFSSDAGDTTGSINEGNSGGSAGVALSDIDLTTGDLDDILAGIDNALDNVTAARTTLGASYNSLEARSDSVSVAKEAALSSRSRVMDTDYGKEVSIRLSAQIRQTATASLSSSNNANASLALNLLPLVKSY